MKKICCFLAAAVLLILSVTLTSAAEGDAVVPSLFHNDEAWYKDGAAPLVCREEIYYVPAELFDLFAGVDVTEPTDNNLLISNKDGRYISILCAEGRAAVNGVIEEDVRVFREGSVTYVDAGQIAGTVGITAETIPHADGSVSMRLTDGTELLTTEDLLASYFPEEPVEDEFAGLEEKEHLNLKRIFILCREPAADTDEDHRALDLLQKYDMGYTLFLSGGTTTESLLHALAGGEYGILPAAESGEDAVTELNEINERFGAITHYRTHFTMTTGRISEDEKLIAAAYCPVTPDFIVDASVNAEIMFADMLQYLGEHTYCFLLLEDCPQTAEMLKLMNKINREQFITSNLGH